MFGSSRKAIFVLGMNEEQKAALIEELKGAVVDYEFREFPPEVLFIRRGKDEDETAYYKKQDSLAACANGIKIAVIDIPHGKEWNFADQTWDTMFGGGFNYAYPSYARTPFDYIQFHNKTRFFIFADKLPRISDEIPADEKEAIKKRYFVLHFKK